MISLPFQRARTSDLTELYELELACFGADAFSRRQLKYLLEQAKGEFWLSRNEQQISTYLIVLKRKNSNGLRLYSLAVAPSFRGKGSGEQLLLKAEERARELDRQFLYLEVNETNAAAIQLYLRRGYEVFGERKSYYADGSSALLMRKFL